MFFLLLNTNILPPLLITSIKIVSKESLNEIDIYYQLYIWGRFYFFGGGKVGEKSPLLVRED